MNNITIIYISAVLFVICSIVSIFLWFKQDIRKAIIDVVFFGLKFKKRSNKNDSDKTVPLMRNEKVIEETAILKSSVEETTVLDNKLIILEEIKFASDL